MQHSHHLYYGSWRNPDAYLSHEIGCNRVPCIVAVASRALGLGVSVGDQVTITDGRAADQVERTFARLIGSSAALESVLAQVEQVGPTDSTVLIEGETGTGK